MNSRERVLGMLDGKPVDRLPCMPITMMFAADHVGVRYLDYAVNYRRLVEGQISVAEDFGLDYVNTMSDPACEAFDCGAAVQFFPNQPPAIDETRALLSDKATLLTLQAPDANAPGRMHNRLQALSLFKERVGDEKIVEGWIEGPCAQGADLRGINSLMLDFYDDPAFVRDLFEFVLNMELQFAHEQAALGVDIIGIGDAAASIVGPRIYRDFVWPYEKRMVDALHEMGVRVRLHICGDTRSMLEDMARLGCDLVELDSPVPLELAREKMGPDQVLIGNVDPVRVMRDGNPETITAAIAECHRQAGSRYIVAAGCEIPRDTPKENFCALVAYARTHKA
jgi:MtaA/CmuA family methyltransferase